MSNTVIKVENLSKVYRVGQWGTGTVSHDLNRWWKTKILGKDDPYAKVGQTNDRTKKAGKDEYVYALQDINFEVKQGKVLGIIGKNGAGKSTLLKVLSRITAPTAGFAQIKGRVASLLEVGTGFHPEMTGRENIYLNGTINGMTRQEITGKLDEIIDFAGVAKYLDTPVKRYSSGMTVRLGFAVAAFLEPEILVVDEVLAVGDAEFQKKAIGKMKDVSKGEGRTVLFVSHNMGSIATLCKSTVFMSNGIIEQIGPTKEIIQKYMKSSAVNKTKNENVYKNEIYKIKVENLSCTVQEKNIGYNLLVTFDIYSENPNRGIGIAINLNTKSGQKISHQGAILSGFIIPELMGKKTVKISAKQIEKYLTAGEYSIEVKIVVPTIEEILCINDNLDFKMPEIDFYNHGYPLLADYHGPVALKYDFNYC